MASADNLKVSAPTPTPTSAEAPVKPSSAHGTEATQASAEPAGSGSHPQVEATQPTGGSVDPLTGAVPGSTSGSTIKGGKKKRKKRNQISQDAWDEHDKEYYRMVELELRKAKATKRQASYIRQKFNGTISQAICVRLHPDSTYLQQYEAEKQALAIAIACPALPPEEVLDLPEQD
ncbi:hypothetical protein AAVH_05550 [Aphelenchoides avenae]|nr:hypothetical protein AAVH_05550 [Aphelenchus avenae]